VLAAAALHDVAGPGVSHLVGVACAVLALDLVGDGRWRHERILPRHAHANAAAGGTSLIVPYVSGRIRWAAPHVIGTAGSSCFRRGWWGSEPIGSAQLLPNSSSNKNWIAGFLARRRPPDQPALAVAAPPHPAERARAWQRALESGEVRSRAELARREGVSRARVTQVLRRLR
jgi:hypothetical protein